MLSDIHLGHRDTTTSWIIQNLDRTFDHYRDDSQWTSLDAIFIAGDLFDSPLPLNSPVRAEVIEWASRILPWCARHRISFIILEGTPSHDADQPKMLEDLANTFKLMYPDLDFLYVNDLSIRWHERLQRNIVYVPDCCRDSCREVEDWVEAEMRRLNLDQIDMAVMHGVFGYQLRFGSEDHKYRERWWLDRVRGYLHIGHHHTFSQYERIVAEGSYDRLRHGEEEPKGFVWARDMGEERWFTFVENPGAKIYHTVKLTSMDLDKSLARIAKSTESLPTGAHVRVMAPRGHPVLQATREIINIYNAFVMKFEPEKDAEEDKQITLNSDLPLATYVPVTLTPDNVVAHAMDYIEHRMLDVQPSDYPALKAYLESMV